MVLSGLLWNPYLVPTEFKWLVTTSGFRSVNPIRIKYSNCGTVHPFCSRDAYSRRTTAFETRDRCTFELSICDLKNFLLTVKASATQLV